MGGFFNFSLWDIFGPVIKGGILAGRAAKYGMDTIKYQNEIAELKQLLKDKGFNTVEDAKKAFIAGEITMEQYVAFKDVLES